VLELENLLVFLFHEFDLSALDQSKGMIEKFSQMQPSIPIKEGTAESIPSNDKTYDAIFIAQAFHWFANEKALTEIHRVLKPGGSLVLIWNLEDRENERWVARLRDSYEKFEDAAPQYRHQTWKNVWQTATVKKLFSELQDRHMAHIISCTPDMIWKRVLSKSFISNLALKDPKALEKLKDDILNILKEEIPKVSHINSLVDDQNLLIDYPYNTDVYWAKALQ